MKRIFALAAIACLFTATLLGGLITETSGALAEDGKLRVVTTIFPPYDFIRQIAGDNVELTMLLSPGAESHSFEPSPRDIIAIQNSDLFLHVGGESDVWVDRILESMDTENMKILALVDMVDTVEEEIVEGMEHSHDHGEAEEALPPKDRPITDFDGDWKTGMPYLLDGTLDEWVKTKAEENEVSVEEMLETYKTRWASDYDTYSVHNGQVTLNGITAQYAYAGFEPTETSAWYILKLADGTPNMPTYLLFNDHGTGNEAGDDHGEEGVAHTHFRYGENVEELMNVENWSTMYFDASATADQVRETMVGHDHGHSHSETFEDSDVQDRPTLADWQGDWQSGYPYVLDGTLDHVFVEKAEQDDSKTAEEYKQYYTTGYETEYDRVVIDGETISYYMGDTVQKAAYEYRGFEILTYESGGKGVRYLFEAVGETNGAPKFIQFSDHMIQPTEDLHHFHIYMGNDGFAALLEEMDNWPTFFRADMDGEAIAEDMLGHSHSHDEEDHDHDHDHEAELDEHVWTSPKNAKLIVAQLTEALASLDPANAQTYRENAMAYLVELDALDLAFEAVVKDSSRRTILFGDRFPFRYLAKDYGLDYFAAFTGCSTDTEASAATIAFLIDKTKEENLPVVFTIEFSNGKIADTIAASTNATKLEMHSVHNVSRSDFESGTGYLELMWRNVESLKQALQ